MNNLQHSSVFTGLLLCAILVCVEGNFDFTVRFYEYWNPTGLCGECGSNDSVPVCCDDPLRTENCVNSGVLRCDTRFRFIQRPFNASLETAPDSGFVITPSHTNLNHEVNNIGRVGSGGFLGLPNPNTQMNTSPWAGRIQFLIDAFDRINNNQAPNETSGIVDRFVINLDQLQFGTNFTQRTSYFGIYNISQLDMSFRVECSENYYGPDCTTFCEAELPYSCSNDGIRVCAENYYGPDCTTFCEPVEGQYSCDSNGSIICIGMNRDLGSNCMDCSEGFYGPDCTVFCVASEGMYTCDENGGIVCDNKYRDPVSNCTQCLPQRNDTTNCTECLMNYYGSNCMTFCNEVQKLYSCNENGHVVCNDPRQDNNTNCRQCLPGYTMSSNEGSCLPVSDSSIALIGGVVGGVAGLLLCVLIILGFVVCFMCFQLRKTHQRELTATGSDYTSEPVTVKSAKSATGGSAEHNFSNPIYDAANASEKKTPIFDDSEYSTLQHGGSTKKPNPYFENGASKSSLDTLEHEQPTYDTADHPPSSTALPIYSTARHPPMKSSEEKPEYDVTSHMTSSAKLHTHNNNPLTPDANEYVTKRPPLQQSTTAIYDSADVHPAAYDDIINPPTEPKSELPVYDVAFNPPAASTAYDDVADPKPQPYLPVHDSGNNPPDFYDDIMTNGPTQTKPSSHSYTYIDTPGNGQLSSSSPAAAPASIYDDVADPKPQVQPNLPVYDTADNRPGVYDDVTNGPNKQKLPTSKHQYTYIENPTSNGQTSTRPAVYDYADTTISVSLPKEPLTYDYADNPVRVTLPPESAQTTGQGVPPLHSYATLENPVYTNTKPGEITKESTDHYDLGQQ